MGPLAGYRVVEFSQGIAGPYCCMELADAGADVIKVEPLTGDVARHWGPSQVAGESTVFLSLNRNKRSIALDLTTDLGLKAALRLAERADVVVVDDNIGRDSALGYEKITRFNERIVYCRISGYGEHGPWVEHKAGELPAQLLSEVTSSLGTLGNAPVRVGVPIGNMYAGIHAVQGICAALLSRINTNRGQLVGVSLFGSLLNMRSTLWVALSNPDEWWGFHLDNYVKPPFHGYRCKDGSVYFQLRNIQTMDLDGLLRELNMLWVKDDPLYPLFRQDAAGGIGRYAHQVQHLWEKGFAAFTTEEVIQIIERYGGTAYPVNDYQQLMEDEQVRQLGVFYKRSFREWGDLWMIDKPWKFSRDNPDEDIPPPRLGQHTREVLQESGWDPQEVSSLIFSGVAVCNG